MTCDEGRFESGTGIASRETRICCFRRRFSGSRQLEGLNEESLADPLDYGSQSPAIKDALKGTTTLISLMEWR